MSVDWDAKQMGDAMIVGRRGNRLAVGRPCGPPWNSSELLSTRTFVPSACIVYSRDCPSCLTENAIWRPSREIAGPPKIRTPCPVHNSVAVPFSTFQMLSLRPVAET